MFLDYINLIEIFVLSFLLFLNIKRERYIFKSFAYIYSIFAFIDILNYLCNISYAHKLIFSVQAILFFTALVTKIIYILSLSKKKPVRLNRNNVFVGFYKPKTKQQFFKSLFGAPVGSACAIVYHNNHYRMYRLEVGQPKLCETILDEKYIEKIKLRYVLFDTNTHIDNFEEIRKELLKQKARQLGTFGLRFNCVRSLRPLWSRMSNVWKYKRFTFDFLSTFFLIKRIKKL